MEGAPIYAKEAMEGFVKEETVKTEWTNKAPVLAVDVRNSYNLI